MSKTVPYQIPIVDLHAQYGKIREEARLVFALPPYPEMTAAQQEIVIVAINGFYRA